MDDAGKPDIHYNRNAARKCYQTRPPPRLRDYVLKFNKPARTKSIGCIPLTPAHSFLKGIAIRAGICYDEINPYPAIRPNRKKRAAARAPPP